MSIQADQDLADIFVYSHKHFGLEQAVKYVSDFDKSFETLSNYPDLGQKRNEVKSGLYSFPKESHIIFYRILHDHIRIVRILHSSRDVPRHFKDL